MEGSERREEVGTGDERALTHKLGNLPDVHREIIQFGGPQESLPTALPKVHPGLSNCPAPLKIS